MPSAPISLASAIMSSSKLVPCSSVRPKFLLLPGQPAADRLALLDQLGIGVPMICSTASA